MFPGGLQTEQKIGGCREALENEINLKDSDEHRRPLPRYLVGLGSAPSPYYTSKYPTHKMVLDARTQQVLIDQLFQ